MPDWLGAVAEWNPLWPTLNATRELFGNPGSGGRSWVAQHAELMAVAWPLAIVAVFFPLSCGPTGRSETEPGLCLADHAPRRER
jgi:ABC-2 type transport system permease protein